MKRNHVRSQENSGIDGAGQNNLAASFFLRRSVGNELPVLGVDKRLNAQGVDRLEKKLGSINGLAFGQVGMEVFEAECNNRVLVNQCKNVCNKCQFYLNLSIVVTPIVV